MLLMMLLMLLESGFGCLPVARNLHGTGDRVFVAELLLFSMMTCFYLMLLLMMMIEEFDLRLSSSIAPAFLMMEDGKELSLYLLLMLLMVMVVVMAVVVAMTLVMVLLLLLLQLKIVVLQDIRLGMKLHSAWDRYFQLSFNREKSLCVTVYQFVGPVVKASTSRAADPGFDSCLRRDFSGSSHTSVLKKWYSSGYAARRLTL